jgi:hypothetical protein
MREENIKTREIWCYEHQTPNKIERADYTNDFELDAISGFDDVELPVCRCCGVIGQNSSRTSYLFKTAGFENSDFVCRFCTRCVGKGAQ